MKFLELNDEIYNLGDIIWIYQDEQGNALLQIRGKQAPVKPNVSYLLIRRALRIGGHLRSIDREK